VKFRIRREDCHGKPPVYYAQRRLWCGVWVSCWYDGYGDCQWAKNYSTEELARDAIRRWQLGCKTTTVWLEVT
jgi:hypothetical protein